MEANEAMATLLECPASDLSGCSAAELGAGQRDRTLLDDAMREVGTAESALHRERMRLRLPDGGDRWVDTTVIGLPGDRSDATYPVLIIEDAHELHLLQETLRRQNVEDRLTQLATQDGFDAKLDTMHSTPAPERAALVYLDIDGFKVINDGLGAGAGDRVLQGVARTLVTCFAEHDALVARLSGDGFGVLMHGDLTPATVISQVETAMAELAEPLYVDGQGISVSISAGIAIRETPIAQPAELLRAAEITLHRAKERGRAQWMLYEPELDLQDRRRYQLGAVIGGGLENGEFELEYQPTIKLDGSNEIAVVNAALRWNHPDRGRLPASEFYPLADTTGMTLALGKLLLTASIDEMAGWRAKFGTAAPDLCLRLPLRLATDPNLVGMVRAELDRHELPGNVVRLCADSAALLDPYGEGLDSLAVLAELDVQIALAISGAADLELIRTHKLPVGFLVLSGPLIDALATDEDDLTSSTAHLASLIDRAHELGLRRIGAEGVRTSAHAERLRALGIVAARGELFGGVADSTQIETLLRAHAAASPGT